VKKNGLSTLPPPFTLRAKNKWAPLKVSVFFFLSPFPLVSNNQCFFFSPSSLPGRKQGPGVEEKTPVLFPLFFFFYQNEEGKFFFFLSPLFSGRDGQYEKICPPIRRPPLLFSPGELA